MERESWGGKEWKFTVTPEGVLSLWLTTMWDEGPGVITLRAAVPVVEILWASELIAGPLHLPLHLPVGLFHKHPLGPHTVLSVGPYLMMLG